MLRLIFHPEISSEIRESFLWYQKQSNGLGFEFIQELEEAFESIQSLPLTWPKMGKNHRRYILSRFPYSVIYKLKADTEILIVAIMHNQRKPSYWGGRS